jgi:hypothetical protein
MSRLFGLTMMVVALTQTRITFARPPAAFWLFGAYIFLVALSALTAPAGYWEQARGSILTLVQLVVLFWIASNLLRYPRFATASVAALALATLVVAFLNLAGVGLTTIPETGRVSMFGEDPNTVAGMLALGILAWIGLGSELGRRTKWGRYWLLACVPISLAVIRTGSRGGVVALLCGVLTLLLEKKHDRVARRSRWVVIGVAVAIVAGVALSSTNARRWGATLTEGNVAGRERIFPAAWEMFLERPILGWGPVSNVIELGGRIGGSSKRDPNVATRDTHNGLLWVLTEVGLVGSIPYVLALWLCFRAAWRGRLRAYGILPLAMLICVMTINMSVTWQNRKFYWLILGFGVASAQTFDARRATKPKRPIASQGVRALASMS